MTGDTIVTEIVGRWVAVLPDGRRETFMTNAEAWRWIDRRNGEPISRSEDVAEWFGTRRKDLMVDIPLMDTKMSGPADISWRANRGEVDPIGRTT